MKHILTGVAFSISLLLCTVCAHAAPYASIVVDIRDGAVLYDRDADLRLHPAGLTKLMTLYVTFSLIRSGNLELDQIVTISRNAASQPPVDLGLEHGMKIKLRYLIRATGVMGANDAATAIGEAVASDKDRFAQTANKFARALGMNNTTLKNSNGLTEPGHMSTARDMATLTLAMRRDFPEFWNLFGRRQTHVGIKTATHSGRRLLDACQGIEAVKIGKTRAAGYNAISVASQQGKSILVVIFGSRSIVELRDKLSNLCELGFSRASSGPTVSE